MNALIRSFSNQPKRESVLDVLPDPVQFIGNIGVDTCEVEKEMITIMIFRCKIKEEVSKANRKSRNRQANTDSQ